MSPQAALALHGLELDRAVHSIVFESKARKVPPYSTDTATALTILDRLPLFVASVDPSRDDFIPDKPFLAGRLQYEPSVKGDITLIRVAGATLPLALCRAALIVLGQSGTVKPARQPATPRTSVSIGDKLGAQVKARRADEFAHQQRLALPRSVRQPSARVTTSFTRQPMPQRKQAKPAGLAQP